MSSGIDVSAEDRLIPLCAPEISGNEWKYVKECLDTGWVSSAGPFVERFELETARYVGARQGVAVSNGTAALHVALKVVGVRPDDEVLVSDLTFVAAANAVSYCRAHPVLMDADRTTWEMDVDKVARFLDEECVVDKSECRNRRTGRRVRAILPVHILGMSCRIDRIMELARRYSLKVVEDSAEALGVRFADRHVGTFGDIGAFSFNGNKILTSGGGGMLVTDNEEYAKRARYLTTQAKDDPQEYFHNEVGYNYRLSNIQAALGVAQLEQIDRFIDRKRSIARTYEDAFRDLPGVETMPAETPGVRPTFWLYTVLLDEAITLEERRRFVSAIRKDGVGARSLWHPIHDLPPYRGCQAYDIQISPELFRRAISLPSSVGIPEDDLGRSISVFKKNLPG